MKDPLFNSPGVYLITEGLATAENFSQASAKILDTIEIAVRANVSLIQIREKKLSANLIFKLVREAVKKTTGTTTKILVNDRADIAFAAQADGVHLTSQSLPAAVIRKIFPPNFIIGVSTHSFEETAAAVRQKADFATFGPVFKTPSKEKYGEPQGLENLREVCEKLSSFPIVALGGINETNYLKTLENGAQGFAAIRFLNDSENLQNLKF